MLHDFREGRIEVALAAGIYDMNGLSGSAGCFLNLSQLQLRCWGRSDLRARRSCSPRGATGATAPVAFAVTTGEKLIAPVAFPPGRARLATRPDFTGSPPPVNTIGMVEVAALATTAGCTPPVATMTAT